MLIFVLFFSLCFAIPDDVLATSKDQYYVKFDKYNWYPEKRAYVVMERCINQTNDIYIAYNLTHLKHLYYNSYDNCKEDRDREYFMKGEYMAFSWYGRIYDMDLDGMVQYARHVLNKDDPVDQITVSPVGHCFIMYYNQSVRYTLVNNDSAVIQDWYYGARCDLLTESMYIELSKWQYPQGADAGQMTYFEYNASTMKYIVVAVFLALFLI